jgi:acetyl esterase/lipase
MSTPSVLNAPVRLPGRLGDPEMTLGTDPRIDPRLAATVAKLGLDGHTPELALNRTTPRDQVLAAIAEMEQNFVQVFTGVLEGVPAVAGVSIETLSITGPDGNDIVLYVHRPTAAPDGPLPCMVHLHGGGMVLLAAADPAYVHWRNALAATGMVVVGVEFRNGGGKLGPHPFPAGLNDCVSGLRWVLDNKDRIGAGKVIVSGESGGGNLTLAVALRAKREGWANRIDGLYALCPYISNQWDEQPAELPSLHENQSYFLGNDVLTLLAEAYDPGNGNAADPTCWPLRAADADLAGLPPHVISVNELDPLRDEGLTYLRRLMANGVSAVGRTVPGTSHAADVLFPGQLPDVTAATIRDIKGFADSL